MFSVRNRCLLTGSAEGGYWRKNSFGCCVTAVVSDFEVYASCLRNIKKIK